MLNTYICLFISECFTDSMLVNFSSPIQLYIMRLYFNLIRLIDRKKKKYAGVGFCHYALICTVYACAYERSLRF